MCKCGSGCRENRVRTGRQPVAQNYKTTLSYYSAGAKQGHATAQPVPRTSSYRSFPGLRTIKKVTRFGPNWDRSRLLGREQDSITARDSKEQNVYRKAPRTRPITCSIVSWARPL